MNKHEHVIYMYMYMYIAYVDLDMAAAGFSQFSKQIPKPFHHVYVHTCIMHLLYMYMCMYICCKTLIGMHELHGRMHPILQQIC